MFEKLTFGTFAHKVNETISKILFLSNVLLIDLSIIEIIIASDLFQTNNNIRKSGGRLICLLTRWLLQSVALWVVSNINVNRLARLA